MVGWTVSFPDSGKGNGRSFSNQLGEAISMSFAIRAVISALAGIGAGAVGFWVVWRCFIGTAFDQLAAGTGYDSWLLVGIFAPGILTAVLTFWATSPKTAATT
jgi:hypothetical protein